jgi:hypothetical protein
MKKNFTAYVIAVALVFSLFYLLPYAVKMSSRWESRTNPTKNTSVVLDDGREVSGDFFVDWSGDYVLITDNGQLHFNTFRSMSVPKSGASKSPPWRLFFFPGLLMALYCVAIFPIMAMMKPRG